MLFVEVLTMAILTTAWLYLVVVLLSSSPIIIDVDMFSCDFFQRSKLNLPLEIGFLNVCPVLNAFSITTPGHFLRAGDLYIQPGRPYGILSSHQNSF